MRLAELNTTVLEVTETLNGVGASPSNFLVACRDMLPEERCRVIANLCDLSQMASHLAGLAADDLAED